MTCKMCLKGVFLKSESFSLIALGVSRWWKKNMRLSTLLKSLTKYCSVHCTVYTGLSKIHCPVYVCCSNLLLRVHHHISMYTDGYLEYTIKYLDTILQCTQIYLKYTVRPISLHQIYAYSESTISLCAENILSTMLKNLTQ